MENINGYLRDDVPPIFCSICDERIEWIARKEPYFHPDWEMPLHLNALEKYRAYNFVTKHTENLASHPECFAKSRFPKNPGDSLTKDLLSRSGIPPELYHKTFANYIQNDQNRKFYMAMKNWTFEQDGFFLSSGSGTGKTHLCISILLDQISKGRAGYFIESSKFFRDIMESRMHDSYEEKERGNRLLQKAKDVLILVIDDLGSENLSNAKDAALYELLNVRCNRSATHKTFISTNLSSEELSNNIPDRNISRIHEMCNIRSMKIDDFRKSKKLTITAKEEHAAQ